MNATRNAASGATAIPSVSSQRNEQDLLSSSLQTCQLGMSTLYLEVMLSDWQPSADCFHLPIANSFYICWDSNDGSDYERDGGRSRPLFHGRWHCQIHFQALSATHETNGVSKRGSCRAGLFFYMHSSWKKKPSWFEKWPAHLKACQRTRQWTKNAGSALFWFNYQRKGSSLLMALVGFPHIHPARRPFKVAIVTRSNHYRPKWSYERFSLCNRRHDRGNNSKPIRRKVRDVAYSDFSAALTMV